MTTKLLQAYTPLDYCKKKTMKSKIIKRNPVYIATYAAKSVSGSAFLLLSLIYGRVFW
jgi:hypothetical protein